MIAKALSVLSKTDWPGLYGLASPRKHGDDLEVYAPHWYAAPVGLLATFRRNNHDAYATGGLPNETCASIGLGFGQGAGKLVPKAASAGVCPLSLRTRVIGPGEFGAMPIC